MNTILKLSAGVLMLTLAACGASVNDAISKKKEELKELKEEQQTLTNDLTKVSDKVKKLEDELAKLDSSFRKPEKAKLVAVVAVAPERFTHYVDLKGKIDAVNTAWVTPRGLGGQVKALYIKQGDVVKKGQLLLKLDDGVTRQQIEQAKIQLSAAKTYYERRKNLWAQNIGAEIDLINAKAAMDGVAKQVDLLENQLDMANVYAEMSGVAEQVTIRVGETLSAQTANLMGIRIVNTNDLKAVADVPENYLSKVGVGSNVLITLPESNNDTIRARVNVASKLIDPANRTFYIEARVPATNSLRANQLAIVRIQDYTTADAITIPVSTLGSDDKGKFVMVAVKDKGKLTATKRAVTVGELYGNKLEIKSGLQAGDQLITEGFQGLYEGQVITTDVK
ncbi:efflux RND transporter periplasmic adaptor subunit [Pseudoflavitalea sp. G-6-1-2]|uniref:efflux RND transporter periplasmic adaptor subunit n=1 Tax=Pseudoflavitalea sp. G-6-1-2 TaxID=2728841 RepID=UPI00146F17EA|nr:efflux RND transporter periplasmic adaptor subunit [Pseudoflavitalea sp. G-6-1-2]NML20324.1 efflux RND transporter periplasmic adaptor subunit [Pseudoflavitalea sp. G-6-1-2]